METWKKLAIAGAAALGAYAIAVWRHWVPNPFEATPADNIKIRTAALKAMVVAANEVAKTTGNFAEIDRLFSLWLESHPGATRAVFDQAFGITEPPHPRYRGV
jgi:hypothetical protein